MDFEHELKALECMLTGKPRDVIRSELTHLDEVELNDFTDALDSLASMVDDEAMSRIDEDMPL